jgi:trehalose-6-phosphate synthase
MRHRFRSFLSLGIIVVFTVFLFTSLHKPGAWHDFPLSLLPKAWHSPLLLEFLQAFIIALATYLIVRWDMMIPVLRVSEWMKTLRLGSSAEPAPPLTKGLFEPLAKEVTYMAKSLTEARAAAEEEARLRQAGESLWTPERLKEHVRQKLPGRSLLVISNREPYQHVRQGSQISTVIPPSGLVTALEPILRACGGTWIAQATGNADRETVDDRDHVQVPPENPAYTLRRIWISQEEEKGFYYGFSNEGLWPLCHIAHTRPIFRPEDWLAYQSVNEKFAEAALQEMEGLTDPFVLVQDYHFALLPKLIKDKRPDARIALFWHIPWPNPESFGICPWRKDVLTGMLGADLLGFHIQYHCNHFLDTVDQVLESRIDWERFTVNRQGHTTWVKPLPISIAFSAASTVPAQTKDDRPDKADLLKSLGIKGRFLGVGVDRIDYTKGILERFRAVEQFLANNPSYVGDFTFVELGAPSRTLIKRYDDLTWELMQETSRINARFQTRDWKPIVFLKGQHSHQTIEPYYRAADVCLVTSLHDGMNLVAKEFVAAREDEDGVLILSRFTGASRELRDALIVNPYDIDQMATALRTALEMSRPERQARMRHLRETVLEHNIYRWGANLITGLSQIRSPSEAPAGKV